MFDKEVRQYFDESDRQNPHAKKERKYFRFLISIAENILRMRKAAGMTQQDLAQQMHTSRSSIALWETPVYEGYSLKKLYEIAEHLGHTLDIRFISKSEIPGRTVTKTIGEGGWDQPVGLQLSTYNDNKRGARITSVELIANKQGASK
jgi:transcriptional regulator with XRE-family HTH domain